jgi:hypothetical protein
MSIGYGYPDDRDLDRLENWTLDQGINAGLDFAAALWSDYGTVLHTLTAGEAEVVHQEWDAAGVQRYRFLRFATGGWSGNESVIAAIRANWVLRSRWCLSSRGGLHIYEYVK